MSTSRELFRKRRFKRRASARLVVSNQIILATSGAASDKDYPEYIAPMANPRKLNLLEDLQNRFGRLTKLSGSNSLFVVGDNAAHLYLHYSKRHSRGEAFFGLRDVDLLQLQGQNSFICFFTDAGELVFVPYADFEQLFDRKQLANDGQYKVQLVENEGATALYIPRKGRFNVDGYVGYDTLISSVSAAKLRPKLDLTHSQVQTLLAAIGHLKGFDVWVPSDNLCALDWSMTARFDPCETLPSRYDPIRPVLCEIDVVWLAAGRDALEGLFEVEHSTPVYSGLLRFNDVFLANSSVRNFFIVSNDTRRDVFSRQINRPTFRRSGLSEITSFLEYANVWDWHQRVKGALHEKITG